MLFFSDNKDLLIILLVKLGIIASLAALLARSLKFKKTLYAEPRGFQEKLNLVLYWGVPLAIGVAIRNGLGYPAFDLTLELFHLPFQSLALPVKNFDLFGSGLPLHLMHALLFVGFEGPFLRVLIDVALVFFCF